MASGGGEVGSHRMLPPADRSRRSLNNSRDSASSITSITSMPPGLLRQLEQQQMEIERLRMQNSQMNQQVTVFGSVVGGDDSMIGVCASQVEEALLMAKEANDKKSQADRDVDLLRAQCQRLEAEINVIVDEIGFVKDVGSMAR